MIEPPEYATIDAEYGLVGIGIPSETEGSGPIKFISRVGHKPACIVDYRIVLSKNLTDAGQLYPFRFRSCIGVVLLTFVMTRFGAGKRDTVYGDIWTRTIDLALVGT